MRREENNGLFDKDENEKGKRNGLAIEKGFSFGNKNTMVLFDFTLFVLEKLGRLNNLFQGRYTDLSLMWDAIESFKAHITHFIEQHSYDPTMGILCLNGLRSDEIELFSSSLLLLKKSLSLRFVCPSTGVVVKRSFLQRSLHDNQQQQPQTPCLITNVLKFNTIPHDIIFFNTPPSFLPLFLRQEVLMLTREINIKKNSFLDGFNQRISKGTELTGFDVVSKETFHDVFMVVE